MTDQQIQDCMNAIDRIVRERDCGNEMPVRHLAMELLTYREARAAATAKGYTGELLSELVQLLPDKAKKPPGPQHCRCARGCPCPHQRTGMPYDRLCCEYYMEFHHGHTGT